LEGWAAATANEGGDGNWREEGFVVRLLIGNDCARDIKKRRGVGGKGCICGTKEVVVPLYT
jgi:hypothetical protein